MSHLVKRYYIRSFDFILSIAFISLLLAGYGCKKEKVIDKTIILGSPAISISEPTVTSLSSFDIKVDINPGEKQNIKNIKLVFEDLTDLSKPAFEREMNYVVAGGLSQTLSEKFNVSNHDYAVQAVLETDKYKYYSEKLIVRFPKNNFYFETMETGLFGFTNMVDSQVAAFINPGKTFGLICYYNNKTVYKTIEVRLNGTIVVPNNLALEYFTIYSDHLETVGNVTVPAGMPPGDYTVDIYIDGFKFTADKKIRVLAGNWLDFDKQYPGEKLVSFSHFLIGDKLYLVGGEFPYRQVTHSPVWEMDLISYKWTKKKDFPHTAQPGNFEVYTYDLSYNGEGYVVVRNYEAMELWKYNQANDLWTKVTTYPGVGRMKTSCFIINSKLYLTTILNYSDDLADFWSFDFVKGTWTKLNSLTVENNMPNAFCVLNGKAYVHNGSFRLMEYNPVTDQWIYKARFPGYARQGSTLVAFNNNIYMIGGRSSDGIYDSFNDCWQYSPDTDSWYIKVFCPIKLDRGTAFVYGNKIICGLGDQGLGSMDNTLFQFNP